MKFSRIFPFIFFSSYFLLSAENKVDFAREVLPVLSNKCFACHGPDTQKQDLVRLDTEELAKKDLGGYHAIDPSKLKESELLFRIADEDDPMPPKDFDKSLTEQEKSLIKDWVLSGAEYAPHWSFVKPTKDEVIPDGSNPVDHFIARGLKKSGIDFAGEADRATLARRSSLILNGLPPVPEELDEFINDQKDGAYDRFISKLLGRLDYGEHVARYWLDAVRYGDTHGLHLDNRRGIYPYRDWVVRALNANQPIDEFIRFQLAGDLMPNPSEDQKIATGYVRLNPTSGEGGAIRQELQAKNNFDRVETTGTAMLGLSLTCSRCHTHKYDPITHQEYFEFLAFFNNTAEESMDRNKYVYGDHLTVAKDPVSKKKWNDFLKKETEFLKEVKDSGKYNGKDDSLSSLTDLLNADLGKPGNKVRGSSTNYPRNQKPEMAIDDRPGTKYLNRDGNGSGLTIITRLGVVAGVSLTSAEDAPGRDPKTYKLEGSTNGKSFTVISEGEVPSFTKRRQKKEILFDNNSSYQHYRLTFPKLVDVYSKEMQIAEIELLKKDVIAKDDLLARAQVLNAERINSEKNYLTTTLIARELPQQSRRETKILERGEYTKPIGKALNPGVFSVLGKMKEGSPSNRLGLANWMTSDEQPLTSRVLVNRFWLMVFGEGLVRTPEEFGLQGEHPTHPELLDWLAVDFRENGWNLKRLLAQLLSSRTFRQSSARRVDFPDPENKKWGRGPSFRLDAEVVRDLSLWSSGLLNRKIGGEGFKPYQPSGMWIALSHPNSDTKNYKMDTDDSIYRRSLYMYWKRTSPHPMMSLFDAPSRESSCVQRSRTSTSLQSLALLNETQRLEASRKLAERLIRHADEDTARIHYLFELLTSRKPKSIEIDALSELLQNSKARYSKNPSDALKLMEQGLSPTDQKLHTEEVAAWTQVTATMLASDPALLLY